MRDPVLASRRPTTSEPTACSGCRGPAWAWGIRARTRTPARGWGRFEVRRRPGRLRRRPVGRRRREPPSRSPPVRRQASAARCRANPAAVIHGHRRNEHQKQRSTGHQSHGHGTPSRRASRVELKGNLLLRRVSAAWMVGHVDPLKNGFGLQGDPSFDRAAVLGGIEKTRGQRPKDTPDSALTSS